MMYIWKKINLAILCLILSACSSYEPRPHLTEIEGNSFLSNTSSLSNTYIHDPSSKLIICAQRFPDTSFNQSEESNITISMISQGGTESNSDGDEEGSEEVELAGRTPTVLITRELFFRLCEFSRNYGLNKDDAVSLYRKTLDLVGEGWQQEASQTTVTIGDTVQTTNTQSISTTLSESMSDSVSTTQSESTSDTTSGQDTNSKNNTNNDEQDTNTNSDTSIDSMTENADTDDDE